MALFGFFKQTKSKQFIYSPIYYNHQKEELKERVKKIEAEYHSDSQNSREYVAGLKKGYLREQSRINSKGRKVSNMRIVIIMVVLFLAAYYIFYR